MNFFKRGLLSVTRRLGKSFILLAVLFILGNVIAGAISISQATSNVEKNIKERLGTAATVELDYEQIEELDESELMEIDFSSVGTDLIKQIGELPYVKYYDYNATDYLPSEDMERYEGTAGEVDFGDDMIHFEIKGVNYASILDFEEGKANLIDGRVFNDDEITNGSPVTIISKNLAEANHLQVGDTFNLLNQVYDYDEETGEESITDSRDVPLEIIGLFEPTTVNTEQNNDDDFHDFMDGEYQNTLYVPNEMIFQESQFAYGLDDDLSMDDMYLSPIFVLNNAEDAEAFEQETLPLLPQYYIVHHATDTYENIAGPIESMSTLAKYVLIVAVITTILIIGLVVLLFLRDRKHELGIYLSLGESRLRVVGQIMTEVIIISIIGMTLSLFTGNLLAQTVSSSMIESNSSQEEDFYSYTELDPQVSSTDVIDAYEVSLSGEFVLFFYVVGMLTILLSTLIPLIYIVRLNPKKIMM
ncbi:ABC transporter permease [Gracilibacillus sp. S3-1-1]|uniref:ABC transporter permease n=1 Tax=Gracilibacillus pellucidus TaxID=3095368 RepID=A0ACC6M4C6_9BACI|nr:ABC transporter permease [Gracilibacillus sp. S3-1-1]MDX8045753.1 ABC transporter permease [Gracilibacillus sp. S3-1-1]